MGMGDRDPDELDVGLSAAKEEKEEEADKLSFEMQSAGTFAREWFGVERRLSEALDEYCGGKLSGYSRGEFAWEGIGVSDKGRRLKQEDGDKEPGNWWVKRLGVAVPDAGFDGGFDSGIESWEFSVES